MKTDFTPEELRDITDIISRYRSVSGELDSYMEQAEEIQKKVVELSNILDGIKNEEKSLMDSLHSKHGDFGLQDIYDAIL